MATGGPPPTIVSVDKVQDDVLKLRNFVKNQPKISQEQQNSIKALYDGVVRSLRKTTPTDTAPRRVPAPRSRHSSLKFRLQMAALPTGLSNDKIPLLPLKRKTGASREYSSNLTSVYLDVLNDIATSGATFKDKYALLTGVGKGLIGYKSVKGLLTSGAHVLIMTSRYNRQTVERVVQTFGSRGSNPGHSPPLL